MKKRIILFLTLLFLIGCPVSVYASSDTAPIKGSFEIDAHEVTNPVKVKLPSGVSTSSSVSSRVNTSMGTSKQINVIYKALKGYKSTVNVKGYKITPKNLQSILNKALEKDYYLFDSILNIGGSYEYTRTNPSYVTKIYFNYQFSKKTMKKRYSSLKSTVTKVKSSLGTGLSKEQAALSVHDYLIKRATYSMSYATAAMKNPYYPIQWNLHSAYGILVDKKGVCSGYAYAYRLFMQAYGIPCVLINSDSMNHAWNMIQLGGKWYHVDCTWDDPDASTSWKGNGSGNLVYYMHFLLNNNEMLQADHYSWTPYKASSSTVYSNMPRYSSNYQIHNKGYWYMVRSDYNNNYLYTRTNLKGTGSTPLCISTSMPVLYNNRFYYVENGSTIRSMNIDGGAKRDITSLTGLPAGTTYVLSGMSNNRLRVQYTLADHTTSYKDVALNSYQQRTTDKATSLKLSASSKTLKLKKSFRLKATVGPSWALTKKVTFASSNKKIAAVGKTSGKVTARKRGKATITVRVTGTSLKKTCKITVK